MKIYREHTGDYCSCQELFPRMKPRKIPYMLVTVSVLACIEVRLSLLEHHFFHQVIMNAVTQLKSYDLTQALLSGSHF